MTNALTDSHVSLKHAEFSQLIDCEAVSNLFNKIKENGIFNETIDIKLNEEILSRKHNGILEEQVKCRDFIDQFIFYRKLRGYTQEQVGNIIGVSGSYYYKYEKRIHKLEDLSQIQKIANFLNIKEELLIPNNYCKKMSINELGDFLKKEKISNSELSRLTGISRRTIVDWLNKGTNISMDSTRKLQAFIERYKQNKKTKEQIEEDELE